MLLCFVGLKLSITSEGGGEAVAASWKRHG